MRTELRDLPVRRTAGPASPQPSRLAVAVAAADSVVIALVYLLIGMRIVTVIEPADDQPAFGFAAAGFFVAFAAVLWLIRRPVVWIVGAAVQAFIVYVYFDLAPARVPPFEEWGIALRFLQLPLIATLLFLAIRGVQRR